LFKERLRWLYSVYLLADIELATRKEKMFMDEVANQLAEPEIATPETSPQVETTPVVEEVNENEKNIRALRQGKKEAERRAQEYERQLKMQQELLERVLLQGNQPPRLPASVDELDTIPPDDYIPFGKVEQLLKRSEQRSEKRAEEAVKKALEDQEKSRFMIKLKSEFPDFDDVVNPETLDLLEQQNPKLAKAIVKSGDPYDMGLQTYMFIKSMNLVDKVPGARRSQEVEKKIEQNSKSVPSPMAFDKRPMAQTFQLTEKNKQELHAEMMRYANMAG
jgi:hypothetical protein